jgi:hypothetical protein
MANTDKNNPDPTLSPQKYATPDSRTRDEQFIYLMALIDFNPEDQLLEKEIEKIIAESCQLGASDNSNTKHQSESIERTENLAAADELDQDSYVNAELISRKDISKVIDTWLGLKKPGVAFVYIPKPGADESDRSFVSGICAKALKQHREGREDQENSNCFTLGFVCNSQQVASTNNSGPVTMMKSLIGQLLHLYHQSKYDFYWEGFDREMEDAMENGKLSILCLVFQYLLQSLPEKSKVYCFLDFCSVYGREELNMKYSGILDDKSKSKTIITEIGDKESDGESTDSEEERAYAWRITEEMVELFQDVNCKAMEKVVLTSTRFIRGVDFDVIYRVVD